MIAAIRLEVAINEGDDLVAGTQRAPVECDAGAGIGADLLRIDTIENHAAARLIHGRQGAALKLGGAQAPIHVIQHQQARGVLAAHACIAGQCVATELRIETHIQTCSRIMELQQCQHPGLRPDITQEQTLAPARVGDDDVRIKPLRPQLCGRQSTGLAADDFGLKIFGQRVGIGTRAALQPIAQQRYVGQPRAPHAQRFDVVACPHQMRREVLELPREVLVDEQDVHDNRLTR